MLLQVLGFVGKFNLAKEMTAYQIKQLKLESRGQQDQINELYDMTDKSDQQMRNMAEKQERDKVELQRKLTTETEERTTDDTKLARELGLLSIVLGRSMALFQPLFTLLQFVLILIGITRAESKAAVDDVRAESKAAVEGVRAESKAKSNFMAHKTAEHGARLTSVEDANTNLEQEHGARLTSVEDASRENTAANIHNGNRITGLRNKHVPRIENLEGTSREHAAGIASTSAATAANTAATAAHADKLNKVGRALLGD